MTSELVMLSLDLVKTRLSVMSMEMRKNFIQVILTSLIEKSPDAKILRAVVKIVEEWVKNNSPMAANQVRGCRGIPPRRRWGEEMGGVEELRSEEHTSELQSR